MKKRKLLYSIMTISVVSLSLFWNPVGHFAADGGQVGQEAVIEFYGEEEPTTSNSTSDGPVKEKPVTSKPVGRYPQTGEIVKKSLALSGAVLALLAAFVYKNKQNKGEKKS
ncbi:LPXTG cell wall anchor domain-containing protein [Candidatus Enterococcus mansonii]|uniref:Gram-positive cocci surface proteins LPxTG domain-containing protein n=1 Tax=Candidatus Enterococcus mansonii TaxID=1834181 RepID=A0A242CJ15_9ENTE|nr:LPXTG cell wall anchor domain-containing protein [Enterococcus sp. 4G2_DIV0659]OTO10149.1 hypothetical protein A5880_000832 [Enterococcus sp. 4G2_DIV0659]